MKAEKETQKQSRPQDLPQLPKTYGGFGVRLCISAHEPDRFRARFGPEVVSALPNGQHEDG